MYKSPYEYKPKLAVVSYPIETSADLAVKQLYPGEAIKLMPEQTITSALEKTERGVSDSAFLPIESSHGGSVSETQKALERTGLSIISEAVVAGENQTRFIELGTQVPEPTDRDKTSIVCQTINQEPGSLVGLMNSLAYRAISMTSVQSRPDGQGRYLFHIDFEGHQKNPNIQEALEEMELKSTEFKVLGSYPVALVSPDLLQ